MKKLVIVGAGGFGRETMDVARQQYEDMFRLPKWLFDWEPIGFIDDDEELWGAEINGYPVIGGIDWLSGKEDVVCVVAVGEPRTKKKIVEKLALVGAKFTNVIHPNAVLSKSVEMGEGNIISAGCLITTNVSIGNHVIFNMGITVGHDTIIGDYCSFMPGAHISGDNHYGAGVYLGTGVSVIQGVSIGEGTTVGANAAVCGDLLPNVLAVGVPAYAKKELERFA